AIIYTDFKDSHAPISVMTSGNEPSASQTNCVDNLIGAHDTSALATEFDDDGALEICHLEDYSLVHPPTSDSSGVSGNRFTTVTHGNELAGGDSERGGKRIRMRSQLATVRSVIISVERLMDCDFQRDVDELRSTTCVFLRFRERKARLCGNRTCKHVPNGNEVTDYAIRWDKKSNLGTVRFGLSHHLNELRGSSPTNPPVIMLIK
ncbi:8288_t:CDS:2, partial [Acaulospora morrowiae]